MENLEKLFKLIEEKDETYKTGKLAPSEAKELFKTYAQLLIKFKQSEDKEKIKKYLKICVENCESVQKLETFKNTPLKIGPFKYPSIKTTAESHSLKDYDSIKKNYVEDLLKLEKRLLQKAQYHDEAFDVRAIVASGKKSVEIYTELQKLYEKMLQRVNLFDRSDNEIRGRLKATTERKKALEKKMSIIRIK